MFRLLSYFSVLLLVVGVACKKGDDYKKYLEGGEIPYPDKGLSVVANGGNNRVEVAWVLPKAGPLPVQYKLYWNNRMDSSLGEILKAGSDTVRILLDNFPEGIYSFELYGLDNAGHRSVPNYFGGKSYGSDYRQSILNRVVSGTNVSRDTLALQWAAKDSGLVFTRLSYRNIQNVVVTADVPADTMLTFLTGYKGGGYVRLQSFYRPEQHAIDTFATVTDSFSVEK